uniref:c-type cytochrome n=1 Tax=Burkholderia sp. E168m23 TaxID=1561200 RepID=UPI001F3A7AC6
MKKRMLLVAALVVIGAALALYGPTLLGFYRLQHHIDTAAQADDADGGPWPRVTDACMGCHGVKGTSLSQAYPSLAGQPAQYVAAQLRAFAGGQRTNPTMDPLAMTMSEADRITSYNVCYTKLLRRGCRSFGRSGRRASRRAYRRPRPRRTHRTRTTRSIS